MSMIALLELSLRNSTNHCLVRDFGDNEWLLPGRTSLPLKQAEQKAISTAISHAQKAAYSKLSYKEKGLLDAFAFPTGVPPGTPHKTAVKKRQALFAVSHGQIIAQTTIYFWKRLYSSQYETDLWKPSIKRVFPNKTLKRSDVSSALEQIYATRNRVAHHEPVYGNRLTSVMQAIEFVRNTLGAKHLEDETAFKKFSRVQFLRLRMDYESFVDAWDTLT